MLRHLDAAGQQQQVRYFGRPDYYYYSPFANGATMRHPAGGYAMASVVSIPAGAGTYRAQPILWRFDALGRVVWRGVARGAEAGVDLGRQPAGLYLLRVTRVDGRTIARKLVR